MSHNPTTDYSIRPGGIMPDVKHQAAARPPTPELNARQTLQNPIGRPGDAQHIPNPDLFPLPNLASRTATVSLAINGGLSIKLPAPIATCMTGLEI